MPEEALLYIINFRRPLPNTLGYENNSIASSPEGSFWYPGTNRSGTAAGDATGTLKGPMQVCR